MKNTNPPSLAKGENPQADLAAAEHVKALYETGMQFEFAPSTIATRAFLDGFALGSYISDAAHEENRQLRRQLARQQRKAFLTESAELNSYYAKSAARRARYHENKAKPTAT